MCALTVVWPITWRLGQNSDRPSTTAWAKQRRRASVLPLECGSGGADAPPAVPLSIQAISGAGTVVITPLLTVAGPGALPQNGRLDAVPAPAPGGRTWIRRAGGGRDLRRCDHDIAHPAVAPERRTRIRRAGGGSGLRRCGHDIGRPAVPAVTPERRTRIRRADWICRSGSGHAKGLEAGKFLPIELFGASLLWFDECSLRRANVVNIDLNQALSGMPADPRCPTRKALRRIVP